MQFLSIIFKEDGKLTREEWIDALTNSKDSQNWILQPDHIRTKLGITKEDQIIEKAFNKELKEKEAENRKSMKIIK